MIDDSTEDDSRVEDLDPASRIVFWRDFVSGLKLDDPEQPVPKASRQGYVTATLPVPGGNAWLVCYRSEPASEVGVYLSYARESIGAQVNDVLLDSWPEILNELGGTASIQSDRNGRKLIQDSVRTGPWSAPAEREKALAWLRARTNDFVNALRPRIKSAVIDLGER